MRWILGLVLALALSVSAIGADKTCSNGSCGTSVPTVTSSHVVNGGGCTQSTGWFHCHRGHGHRCHR